MRVTITPENPLEVLALTANLGPVPAGEALYGMAVSGALIAGVRLGIFANVAQSPQSAQSLAASLGLKVEVVEVLLDALTSMRHLAVRDGGYQLTARSAKWLDPSSPTYIGGFVDACADSWQFWIELPEVAKHGHTFEIHARKYDDPYWDRYIRGQFELARLSAPEVANALKLPSQPRKLLDIAGAHGWFSAVLCQRYPGLHATVVDLPGSAAVGRRIIAELGMQGLVGHVDGNALEVDLGGPYDAALCFNLIHHLAPDEVITLFKRIRGALVPGGTFAVLDAFRSRSDPDRRGSMLSLLFFLTSSGGLHSSSDLADWLRAAGFSAPRPVRVRSIPGFQMYQTTAI